MMVSYNYSTLRKLKQNAFAVIININTINLIEFDFIECNKSSRDVKYISHKCDLMMFRQSVS